VCDSVEQEEGTIFAGGVVWRLGVAVELMEDKSSSEYMQFNALMNSRWQRIFAKVEFVVFLSNIYCTSWVTYGLKVVIGVDRLRVGFESDSSSLGLLYNNL
jgi:hypothetical protein